MNFNQQDQLPSADEQQLIAFHLGEPLGSLAEERALRTRLECDPAFAALSDEIAHTLRVFSADPVPQPDTEAAWQRLRGTLPPLQPARAHRFPRLQIFGGHRAFAFPAAAFAVFVLALLTFTTLRHLRSRPQTDQVDVVRQIPQGATATRSAEAVHLDRAERWLTVVNHSSEPLDADTRAEGQRLLTENAVYLQNARSRGDLSDAAVLDRLDRVLTTSNHPAEAGLQLRLDMNTDGLLFQIRILRQNQTANIGDPR